MNLRFKLPDSEGIEKQIARKDFLEYMDYVWMKPTTPFTVGFHTERIAEALNEAVAKYARGESSYILVRLPFRHGKSDILSRYLPPYFLGRFPESEVIQTSYNSSTAQKFSKDARAIIASSKYRLLFPNTKLNPKVQSVSEWQLDNHLGKTLWAGLSGGGLTGNGANLALIDDPYKGREDAENPLIREKTWEAFTDSLFTRLAPVHILIILATPWHSDGLFARIEKESEENPNFPTFDKLTFPAKAEDYKGDGKYPGKYLFPERFPESWYEAQYAVLGPYGSSGLLDCDPKSRDGNMIQCEEGVNVHYVKQKPENFGRDARAYDLASSSPKTSQDPDWTCGVKGAVKVEIMSIVDPVTNGVEKLRQISIYIDDVMMIREEATSRNQKMIWKAHKDGAASFNLVEEFGQQKDTVSLLKGILGGSRIVKGIRMKGDKLVKIAETLEVPFTAGNVYINENLKGTKVLKEFFAQLEGFPSHAHDDGPDALALLVSELSSGAYDAWWVKNTTVKEKEEYER